MVQLAAGRSFFRAMDLVELVRLANGLRATAVKIGHGCKENLVRTFGPLFAPRTGISPFCAMMAAGGPISIASGLITVLTTGDQDAPSSRRRSGVRGALFNRGARSAVEV